MTWLLIGVAGAAGALARLLLGSYAAERQGGGAIPWGTFAVNMGGSFLLGLLTGSVLARGAVSPMIKLVLGTGFMGAFTTFSTWQNDLFRAYSRGDRRAAWINLLVSTGAGLMAAWAGVLVGWRL